MVFCDEIKHPQTVLLLLLLLFLLLLFLLLSLSLPGLDPVPERKEEVNIFLFLIASIILDNGD
jgi:hypothetical protein